MEAAGGWMGQFEGTAPQCKDMKYTHTHIYTHSGINYWLVWLWMHDYWFNHASGPGIPAGSQDLAHTHTLRTPWTNTHNGHSHHAHSLTHTICQTIYFYCSLTLSHKNWNKESTTHMQFQDLPSLVSQYLNLYGSDCIVKIIKHQLVISCLKSSLCEVDFC